MSLWNPDTSSFDYYYDKGKYKLAWRLSLLFTAVFLIEFIVFSQISFLPALNFGIAFLICFSTIFLIKITKQYKFVFWTYTISASIIIIISFYTIPTIHYPDFIWVLSVIIFAFIGLERKYGLMFVGIHLVALVIFFHTQLNNHLTHLRIQTGTELYSITMEFIFAMLSMTYLLAEYLRLQQFAETKLSDKNSKLETQNEIILQQNIENETLIKEVHHRVKNNLQIIISLLRMQKEVIESPETKQHFQDAIHRILTMSLIHQKLYQENHLSSIDPTHYLNNLSKEILDSSVTNCDVIVCVHSEIRSIGLKTIVPLGLMVNELISNSLKHAFHHLKEGKIIIDLVEQENNGLLFQYSDSGKWLEESEESTGFGAELIETLTQQLEGTYTRTNSSFKFLLKNLD